MSDLETFLFKNKLSDKQFIDILPKLSNLTKECILKDLKEKTAQSTSKTVYIFSDGGCRNNGKSNAKGGYSVYFTDDITHKDNDYTKFNKTKLITQNPTNNKAELSAILLALKIIEENKEFMEPLNIEIISDSKYSIDCITKWIVNWKKNDYRNSKGEVIKNKDLIVSISHLLSKLQSIHTHTVTFKHVFSHTIKPKNEKSLEYFYWYGNFTVDEQINNLMSMV